MNVENNESFNKLFHAWEVEQSIEINLNYCNLDTFSNEWE